MFSKKKKRGKAEVNTSSTADIAFLLLVFFLVTTTINSEKGIAMILPPKDDIRMEIEIKERNVLNILINSNNDLLIEEIPAEMGVITEQVKAFITNNGKDPESSEKPAVAVVSIKADRGTDYKSYISALDAVKKAYNEIRAEKVGLTVAEFKALDLKDAEDRALYDEARETYPMMISEAEPTEIGG